MSFRTGGLRVSWFLNPPVIPPLKTRGDGFPTVAEGAFPLQMKGDVLQDRGFESLLVFEPPCNPPFKNKGGWFPYDAESYLR